MRRLLALAFALVAASSMSGCLLSAAGIGCVFYGDQQACDALEFENSDGSPENVDIDAPIAASVPSKLTLTTAAAKGQKFSANFNATAIGSAKPKRKRGVITVNRIRVLGGFFGDGTPPPELQMFARGGWKGLLTAKLDPKGRKLTVKGLAIATFIDSRAGEACLRFSGKGKRTRGRGRKASVRGSFKIVGSTAGIQASGRYLRKDASVPTGPIGGRGRMKLGKPKPFPKACQRVRKAFNSP